MRVKITADSSCDLSEDLLKGYSVGIIPLSIVKDNVPYKDGLEITPQDIFDYVESGKGICQTAAVNTQEYYDAFSEALKEYDAVVHINIGAGFSACHQNANIAASELENVYVVDSANLSMGMGYLAIIAVRMARNGLEPQEIVEKLESIKGKIETSFVIDTVKYLYKGGRCSALAAIGANVLGLKPCIEVVDGLMDVGKKYRGKRIIEQYVKDRFEGRSDIDPLGVVVVHSGVEQNVVDTAYNEIFKYQNFNETIYSITGCTIANHCGPKTLGIMFFRK